MGWSPFVVKCGRALGRDHAVCPAGAARPRSLPRGAWVVNETPRAQPARDGVTRSQHVG